MAEADLPLVRKWLLEPHVRRWYDDLPTRAYPESTIERYRQAIRGHAPTRRYIFELDGRPVGEIQSYRVDDHPEYAAEVGVDEPAIGIDLFIGEPDLVGRGLGPEMIRRFLRDIAFPLYKVDLCVIGPARSNMPAIRAYEKAGFRFLRIYLEPDTREPEHYLMELRREFGPPAR